MERKWDKNKLSSCDCSNTALTLNKLKKWLHKKVDFFFLSWKDGKLYSRVKTHWKFAYFTRKYVWLQIKMLTLDWANVIQNFRAASSCQGERHPAHLYTLTGKEPGCPGCTHVLSVFVGIHRFSVLHLFPSPLSLFPSCTNLHYQWHELLFVWFSFAIVYWWIFFFANN